MAEKSKACSRPFLKRIHIASLSASSGSNHSTFSRYANFTVQLARRILASKLSKCNPLQPQHVKNVRVHSLNQFTASSFWRRICRWCITQIQLISGAKEVSKEATNSWMKNRNNRKQVLTSWECFCTQMVGYATSSSMELQRRTFTVKTLLA